MACTPGGARRPARRLPVFAVALCAAALFFILCPQAGARRLPADQLVAHLRDVAEREWRDWGRTVVDTRDGTSRIERIGALEHERAWLPGPDACNVRGRGARDCPRRRQPFDAQARVSRYWVIGLGPYGRPARDAAELERVTRHAPWSAVFVSFLMEQVGLAREAFPFDDAHANYLRGLVDSPQFELLLVAETPLAAGDLICGPRDLSSDSDRLTLQRMRTLDDLGRLTSSHCDLVFTIDREAREARLIGGNVADSVALTRIPLTADGRAIRTLARAWYVLARPR